MIVVANCLVTKYVSCICRAEIIITFCLQECHSKVFCHRGRNACGTRQMDGDSYHSSSQPCDICRMSHPNKYVSPHNKTFDQWTVNVVNLEERRRPATNVI